MTATATLNTLTAGTWAIDPTHTEVGFVARHLMVTKVRGSFTDVTGTVEVAENVTDSVANVVIKTAVGQHRHAPTATATCAAPTSSTSRPTPRSPSSPPPSTARPSPAT